MTEDNKPAQRIIVASTKSVGISLILTFFFGPLGMLYSTILGAIIMIIVSILIGIVTFGTGVFLIWPICMIWGAFSAASYNKKLFNEIGQ
ncbi:hypothetical protein N9Y67_01560 [Pseudomonadota bacterium]|nr:hypothetical protein [Pseudomonadota bacterium]